MARANETKLLLSSFLVELDAMESNVRSFFVNNSTAYGKYPASISCKILKESIAPLVLNVTSGPRHLIR